MAWKTMGDLHTALKHDVLASADSAGVQQAVVKLILGKDRHKLSLHCHPNAWSTFGLQKTDYLNLLGFNRTPCQFLPTECYSASITDGFDIQQFSQALEISFRTFERAYQDLQKCGF